MLFASAFGDQMFLGFCLFCFLCWFAMRKLKELDTGGKIRTTARNKILSTITSWLK